MGHVIIEVISVTKKKRTWDSKFGATPRASKQKSVAVEVYQRHGGCKEKVCESFMVCCVTLCLGYSITRIMLLYFFYVVVVGAPRVGS